MQEAVSTQLEHCGHDHSSRTSAADHIMPAECVGVAEVVDGVIDVGGCKIELGRPGYNPRQEGDCVRGGLSVYVRRLFHEGSVFDVALSFGDGLAEEELAEENRQAQTDPRGAKEYWREKSVGHDHYGPDQHVMTNEDFEREWSEAHDVMDHEDQFRSMQEEAQRDPRGPKAYWRKKLIGPGRQQISHEDFEALWENAQYDEDEPPRRLAGFEFLWNDDRETDQAQAKEAHSYPRGAREYWRGQRVGKLASTIDGHLLTDEEFDRHVWPLWEHHLIYFGLDEEARTEVIMARSHLEDRIFDPRTDDADREQLQPAVDQLAKAEKAIEQAMEIVDKVGKVIRH
jgi:hypothetical protein